MVIFLAFSGKALAATSRPQSRATCLSLFLMVMPHITDFQALVSVPWSAWPREQASPTAVSFAFACVPWRQLQVCGCSSPRVPPYPGHRLGEETPRGICFLVAGEVQQKQLWHKSAAPRPGGPAPCLCGVTGAGPRVRPDGGWEGSANAQHGGVGGQEQGFSPPHSGPGTEGKKGHSRLGVEEFRQTCSRVQDREEAAGRWGERPAVPVPVPMPYMSRWEALAPRATP